MEVDDLMRVCRRGNWPSKELPRERVCILGICFSVVILDMTGFCFMIVIEFSMKDREIAWSKSE